MPRSKFTIALRNVALVLFVVLFVLFFYTLLHETGHALAGVLAGGSVVGLNVDFLTISAHARVVGEFTNAQRAWLSVAGPLLPLVVWALFLLVVPREANPVLVMIRVLSTVGVLSTLLVWYVVPFLYMSGRAPVGEDSSNFLLRSGAEPLLVSVVAAALFVGGWVFYRLRIGNLGEEWGVWRRMDGVLDSPQVRRTLAAMLAVWVLAIAGLVGVNALGAGVEQDDMAELLQGHEQIASVELGERAYEEETLYRFTLEQPKAAASFYVLLEDVRAAYVDLSLVGADGFREPLFHGEDFTAGRASAQPVLSLGAGEYEVVLTSRDSRGAVSVYLKVE
ncbi:MAG: hypothetical protein GX552_06695 [Chloroflexi bacterium]|nr:hypothetical protein [Chloroflexota bacterium]